MESAAFVPDDFTVPDGIRTDLFAVEPRQPRHNQSGYRAWTSSREHIKTTPGFAGRELRVDAHPDYAER